VPWSGHNIRPSWEYRRATDTGNLNTERARERAQRREPLCRFPFCHSSFRRLMRTDAVQESGYQGFVLSMPTSSAFITSIPSASASRNCDSKSLGWHSFPACTLTPLCISPYIIICFQSPSDTLVQCARYVFYEDQICCAKPSHNRFAKGRKIVA
jgi:hypothetical protein